MAEGTEPPATQRNDSHFGPAPWVGFCFRQWGLGCGGPGIRQGVGPGRGTGGCPTHAILPHSREGVCVSSLRSVLALYEPLKKRARPAGQSNRRVEAGLVISQRALSWRTYCTVGRPSLLTKLTPRCRTISAMSIKRFRGDASPPSESSSTSSESCHKALGIRRTSGTSKRSPKLWIRSTRGSGGTTGSPRRPSCHRSPSMWWPRGADCRRSLARGVFTEAT